ncbi:MAG: 2-hydroxyglutaryl-CoA dehydratase [Deltaproteobacteria bacterium]|nr:2-hydroxyglutaryl-CoA dehydratase [Deltaproteobacteria bacterium]
MTALGIDLGSRRIKMIAFQDKNILWFKSFDTIPFYKQYSGIHEGKLTIDFSAAGVDIEFQEKAIPVVATGYGRNNIDLENARVIPEIQAHCKGAEFQTGLTTFTLLDMGGQDTKVARVENGLLVDFIMNDKCAASSGRYLESMAAVLDVSLEELSRHASNPIPLNATCGIFGESELIGKIIEGHPLEHLCAGVNNALLKRVLPMLRPFDKDTLIVTGGVAKNGALICLLETSTQARIVVPPHPQFNGAIGCAAQAR